MGFSEAEIQGMQRAIELACRGIGLTSPNPPVGACLIHNKEIIGEGWHHGSGLPHAEREAIADCIRRGHENLLSRSILIVTLEPCSTYGRTPPCTEAILEYGISDIIYGVCDPNPAHAGRADLVLNRHGVQTRHGLMERECAALIRPFSMAILNHRPWITAKIAMTLDGRTKRRPDKGQWITGVEAKKYVHTMRARSDAILIGGETLRSDNPALTIREPLSAISNDKKQPWRVIMTCDRSGLPVDCQCLTDQYSSRTLIFERVDDYHRMLGQLVDDYQIHSLMIESGGRLLRQFLNQGLIDEWVSFHAPILSGGPDLGVAGASYLDREVLLDEQTIEVMGNDVCVRGIIQQSC